MKIWRWIKDTMSGRGTVQASAEARAPSVRNTGALRTPNAGRRIEGEAGVGLLVAEPPPAKPWWERPEATFSEPQTPPEPEWNSAVRMLQDKLIHNFDGHNLSLPPVPHVPRQVLTHLRNPRCSFTQVAKCIAQDPVIAGAVLRMANSVLYGGTQRITTLPAAVTRLGTNPLRMLMLHQSIRAAAFDAAAKDHELAEIVWSRALASAAIMSGLAGLTGGNEDEAFLAGLLHDVGNIVVLREAGAQAMLSRQEIEIDAFEYLAYQCHQELGDLIAHEWQLPDHLRSLIGDHHRPPAADDPLAKQRWQLQLTDMLNAMLGYAPAVHYKLRACCPARELGVWNRKDFVPFLETLPRAIQQVLAMA